MNEHFEEVDPGAEETGHLEGRAPFTMVGDWVVLSGVSHKAIRLYWILAMHLNASRGDRMVWPSKATLASLMELADPKSVDAPMKELVKIGAVVVVRRQYRGRKDFAPNRYIVRDSPPPDYKGRRSLGEFYAARQVRLDAETAASQTLIESNGAAQGVGEKMPLPPEGGLGEESGGGRGDSSPRGGGENAPTNKKYLNKNSPLPSEGENRARDARDAGARANSGSRGGKSRVEPGDSQPALFPSTETDTRDETDGQNSSRPSRDLGNRWHSFLAEQGTPFPASAPGVKFTQFAAFLKMLGLVMVHYSADEVWQALMGLYDRRSEVFPSRNALEAELAAARRGRRPVLRPVPPAGSSRAVPDVDAAAGALVPGGVSGLADRVMRWWTVEQRKFVPSGERSRLRDLLADAIQQGATESSVQEALLATGRACPPDWLFANVLAVVRDGGDPALTVLAASGVKVSSAQVREMKSAANHRRWDAELAAWNAQNGGASATPRDGKIIQGEVS